MKSTIAVLIALVVSMCISCAEQRSIDPRSPILFAQYASSLDRQGVNRLFNDRVADKIRAGQYDDVERDLRLLIDGAPSSDIKSAIADMYGDYVTFSGWSDVFHPITPQAERVRQKSVANRREEIATALSRKDLSPRSRMLYEAANPSFRPITAIGIDISGHIVENLADREASMPFEVSYYSDLPFPFSRVSRETMLAESKGYASPWQGEFESINTALKITGMSRLMWVLGPSWQPRSPIRNAEDRAIRSLAEWWAVLTLTRALASEVKQLSPVRPIPVLMGTHDFGWHVITVHSVD